MAASMAAFSLPQTGILLKVQAVPRSYTIDKRAPELGGGWSLKLFDDDGEEGGGGVFPPAEYATGENSNEEQDREAYADAMGEGEGWANAGW